MEQEKEIAEQVEEITPEAAEEIITEMCLDNAAAEQEKADYGQQLLKLTAQVESLKNENEQLRKSIELLQNLPRFSTQTKSSAEGLSAIREIFRRKN